MLPSYSRGHIRAMQITLPAPRRLLPARPRLDRRWAWLALLPLALLLHRPVEVAFRTTHLVGPLFRALPASGRPHDTVILFLSGDAGFNRGSGPEIADRLTQDGYPVFAIDSLHYFAKRRTPTDDGRLVATAARAALRWTGAHRFVIVGESFGADMTPMAVERLPAPLRARLAAVTLLVPTRTIDLRISLAEWLGWARPDADAATVARRIGTVPMLCIRGSKEPASLCPLLTMPNVRSTVLPGNHYLDHDYDRIAATIERALPSDGTRD